MFVWKIVGSGDGAVVLCLAVQTWALRELQMFEWRYHVISFMPCRFCDRSNRMNLALHLLVLFGLIWSSFMTVQRYVESAL